MPFARTGSMIRSRLVAVVGVGGFVAAAGLAACSDETTPSSGRRGTSGSGGTSGTSVLPLTSARTSTARTDLLLHAAKSYDADRLGDTFGISIERAPTPLA